MKAVFRLIRQRWVAGLIGVILLALVIWFIGPYVAVGPFVPLASPLSRGVTIAVIALGWAGLVLLRWYRARRASRRLGAAIVASDAGGAGVDEELSRRFQEAIAFLRTSRRGRNLYDLPWYVIVGPPGSGKTTALTHSGLSFPLDQKYGRDALRGVGGTRNCDWWFTDEAVLLDTAGRYFTQDSDADSDATEWRGFLELLRRYRRRRPINGVLVTLSATDLLADSPQARERHVATVRRRIDELQRQLGVQVPVYFLVTKCDLVSGFVEFFDDLDHEGRAQVWGMTRPEPVAGGDAAGWFDAEYTRLLDRLDARLLTRLNQEREPQRRGRLFGFPRQMAGLRASLVDFVRQAFQGSGYDRPVMLRGVYFTSGTQEGTPIDRVMESLTRSYGLAVSADSSTVQVPGGQGRSYFIHRLLRDVIFPEAGLAGINWRLEVGRAVAQNAVYAAALAGLGLLVAGWYTSYQHNQGYLADVSSALEVHADTATGTVPAEAGLLDVLPRLDALGEVADEANRYREDRPFLMGMGLYRGDALGESAQEAYLHGVRELLVPRVAQLFEQRLRAPGTSATDVYAYLKGYLMLAQPQRLDRDELDAIVRATLLRELSGQRAMALALAQHFGAYSRSARSFPAIEADEELVARARATLAAASIPGLVLSRLERVFDADHPAALRLDVQAGLGADDLFRRRSGEPLSEPVPALFTQAGFEAITGEVGMDLVEQFQRDRWVLGEDVLPAGRAARLELAADFVRHYEQAYIAFWEDLIADLDLAPLLGVDEAVDMLAAITGSTSPLRRLVVTIGNQLHFPEPADDDAGTGRLDALLGFFEETRAGASEQRPGERIDDHFREFREYVLGADGAEPPLEDVIALLDRLYAELSALGSGLGDQDAMTVLGREGGEALRRVRSEAARQPQPFREWLEGLAGSGQEVALRSLRGQLNQRYRSEVLPVCTELATDRYPLAADGQRDIPLRDFARLFGPGGVMDDFFREHLADLVDASGSRWRWRPGEATSMGMPQSALDQFQRAHLIRELFFDDGSGPAVSFELTPQYLDARARQFRIAIGEEAMTYRHGPPVGQRFDWPRNSGSTEVEFEDRGGNRPNAGYSGPWSWWRALDAAEPAAQSDTAFLATFSVDDYSARVQVAFDSTRNPLRNRQWREFRCPGGL